MVFSRLVDLSDLPGARDDQNHGMYSVRLQEARRVRISKKATSAYLFLDLIVVFFFQLERAQIPSTAASAPSGINNNAPDENEDKDADRSRSSYGSCAAEAAAVARKKSCGVDGRRSSSAEAALIKILEDKPGEEGKRVILRPANG